MKIAFYLVMIFGLLSCSKQAVEQKEDPCNRIISVMEYHPYDMPMYQWKESVIYDDQGRLKSIIGHGTSKAEYTYFNDRIEVKATDISGGDISTTYYLNNAGRIIRTSFFDHDYKYNGDGYLVSYKQPYGTNGQITGFTQYYLEYENGNLVTLYTPDPNVSKSLVTFSYYSDANELLNGYNSTFYRSGIIADRNSFYLINGGYFGKQSKNLIKSVNFNSPSIPTYDILYARDTKRRITNWNQGEFFNYQCP